MEVGMTRALRRLALVALLGVAGCFGEDPAQMLETAKFEEVQRNEPHAREIYERLLANFPDSAEAGEARARLATMDAAAAGEGR
jgi:hypothetical protein